jgi:glutamyl-tRNA synthetase
MDLWPSTLAQLYLAKVQERNKFMDTTFYHHPLITGPGGDKLSKSAGATSIQYLRRAGKTASEIYNILAVKAGAKEKVRDWQDLGRILTML